MQPVSSLLLSPDCNCCCFPFQLSWREPGGVSSQRPTGADGMQPLPIAPASNPFLLHSSHLELGVEGMGAAQSWARAGLSSSKVLLGRMQHLQLPDTRNLNLSHVFSTFCLSSTTCPSDFSTCQFLFSLLKSFKNIFFLFFYSCSFIFMLLSEQLVRA